jgi:hypothetical protein
MRGSRIRLSVVVRADATMDDNVGYVCEVSDWRYRTRVFEGHGAWSALHLALVTLHREYGPDITIQLNQRGWNAVRGRLREIGRSTARTGTCDPVQEYVQERWGFWTTYQP